MADAAQWMENDVDDGDDDEASRSSSDWDLEDALARALLGDVTSDKFHAPPPRSAPAASFRDEAEEEKLIERLHARLFPPVDEPQQNKTRPRTAVHPRPTKREAHLAKPRSSSSAQHEQRQQQPRRSISPSKIDQMVARFRLHEAKRARKLATIEQQQHLRETASLTSSTSTLVSPRQFPSFEVRQAAVLTARERAQQLCRQREEQQQHELAQAFERSVRTPCICGAGTGSDSVATHTAACARFMAMCESMNATSAIQRKKQRMRRSIDDMMRFQAESQRKRQAKAELQRRREQQEATFAPAINAQSHKIYEELVGSGRLRDRSSLRRVGSGGSTTTAEVAPSPARPAITSSVDGKPRKPTPSAAKPKPDRRSSIASRASTRSLSSSAWAGPRRVPTRRSAMPQAASFSESHWIKQATTAASLARRDTPPVPPQPTFVVPWTVVTYNASSCDFILESFDRASCLC